MALMKCFRCGRSLLYMGQHHACSSGKSTDDESGKRVSERATAKRVATGSSDGRADEAKARESGVLVGATAHAPPLSIQAGVGSERPSPSERKIGRPRIGEVRDKPWEALGMSQRTWQRRQAEQRAKE